MTETNILNAVTISQDQVKKTIEEYKKFRELHKSELSEAEKHFIGYMEQTSKKPGQTKKHD